MEFWHSTNALGRSRIQRTMTTSHQANHYNTNTCRWVPLFEALNVDVESTKENHPIYTVQSRKYRRYAVKISTVSYT
ncbi:hypothetical protein L3X38_015159 [Prunus dulcis]|uniref:Uncharacterized protein n=1 Tax=Prunus dulcis TaxID=3755 RepID=A0AAD4WPK5_PRUDU|nr:hypothetical protein L3X38_015159 [Prunus dulcis]